MSLLMNGAELAPVAFAPQKTVAEFFAGIGLVRMGLERHGWSIVFANDIDEQKLKIYSGHFGECKEFILNDIHKINAHQIPTVTLATASFPCSDLSLAGGREGFNGKHSSSYWGFTRLLDEMGERKPPLVLVENVTGFLTSHNGDDFRRALLELNRLGYAVDAFLLDAVSFVPQSRPRLFVVGSLSECSDLTENAIHKSPLRSAALVDFISGHPEIRWGIRALPAPPLRGQRHLTDILEDLPESAPEWWSAERATYLLNQMSERHRRVADYMIATPKWSYGTVFRRMRNGKSTAELRTDGIAGCLRTPKGGSGRQILVKAGYEKYFARLVTPREAARLMGADDFNITVPLNQALFGFGDAVCVSVVEWIATHYLDTLVNELSQEWAPRLAIGGKW